ncbi:hypothetical protein OF117_16590 [Geodermatophilus sp. YIM 151500]|uniref:MmyB family transcriptional regulator n=1 Tax=Geodermatophilus sp. YIM 151500 TaxID=2984531 RepID=UPI0021E3783B|nr:hypothetical protein [Geodermatophilus sp. YIM 151500]MCV2490973.1 hypothetical protein [Geodermatophilus sp. YIM 151500]
MALLRSQAGRAPFDEVLTDLIGGLSTRNDTFRARWARHDVRQHLTGPGCTPLASSSAPASLSGERCSA